jgi:hypothetical protein
MLPHSQIKNSPARIAYHRTFRLQAFPGSKRGGAIGGITSLEIGRGRNAGTGNRNFTSFDIYKSRIADSRLCDGARFLVRGQRLAQHDRLALAEVITISIATWTNRDCRLYTRDPLVAL